MLIVNAISLSVSLIQARRQFYISDLIQEKL